MDILFFDETASTSLQAAEELRQGRKPPFAVIASSQTGGRGRRGRSWNSPPGGIYLTVVVPPPETPGTLLGNIPLWTGVQTAHWLRRECGFHVALKWPNDLMFDGRKLGGILVESGIEGSRQGPVMIGIGINCVHTPTVQDAAGDSSAAPSVALREICGETREPRDLAGSLAAFIVGAWGETPINAAGQEFLSWSPPAMRLYLDRFEQRFWLADQVDSDGTLVLKAVGSSQETRRLNSVDHQLVVASRAHPAPLFLADVGNTATKIKVYASSWSDTLYGETRIGSDGERSVSLSEELSRLAEHAPARGWPLYVAGVAPASVAVLSAAAEVAGFLPLLLAKKPVRHRGDAYAATDLGIDRLAAIEGALIVTRAAVQGATTIIASFGTAMTVDVVDASGRHCGGVIAPGLRLSAKALNEHTGLLPLVSATEIQGADVLGYATRGAIAAGIAGQAAGLLARIIDRHSTAPLNLLLTGGDAGAVAGYFPQAQIVPDLVFLGLKAMTGGGLLRGPSHPVLSNTDA